MDNKDKLKKILTEHCNKYPKLQVQDILKFMHQSIFGCEHAVASLPAVIQRIQDEILQNSNSVSESIEPLDGNYSRVHLSYMNQGLSEETFGKLFYLSSKKERGSFNDLKENLTHIKDLIAQKQLPFSIDEFNDKCKKWELSNFEAVHHSESFRENYSPSYRVISNTYIPFLPLFSKIDEHLKNGSVRLAIEGGSASGKTTLSAMLEEIYNCTILHMDDFFLQPHQRTPEQLSEPGGNIDIERFVQEVLTPLNHDADIQYRRFDCCTMKILPAETITPKKLTVIEGAYSMHPKAVDFYDLSVFLDIDSHLQKIRINKRNTTHMAERFFNEWIPMENRYFETFDIKNKCEMTIKIIE